MTHSRLRDVQITPYDLPFVSAWRTASGTLSRRKGWLVGLRDAHGSQGVGECAPLRWAGTESAVQAHTALVAWSSRCKGRCPEDMLNELGALSATPAARCALECALVDLLARGRGLPVRQMWNDASTDSVAVNASVGRADPQLVTRCHGAVEAGFSVLKVKIGVDSPAAEQALLTSAFAALPSGVSLRLDANGAWSETEARTWLDWLADRPVESLEEPLSAPEPQLLRDLQRRVPFPLALDESVNVTLATARSDAWPVRRAVLKPTAQGGGGPTVMLAKRLADQGVDVVVTTTLEAAPGRWLCAHTAAACGSAVAHGLDTGRWLASDLGPGPIVSAGVCHLGAAPGLGYGLA